ncbi:MAG: 2OG-Fe(II) oxygenase [Allosphingosinicella sp.]
MSAPAPPGRPLEPGDAVPWFAAQALDGRPDYKFDTVAGRHILLLLTPSAGDEAAAAALGAVLAKRPLFDDLHACFFGITADPQDVAQGRIAQMLPGLRWFLDYDRGLAARLGAVDAGGEYRPHMLLLDPMLRVVGRYPLAMAERALADLQAVLAAPPPAAFAPVLTVPHIFEPELCRELIDLYKSSGGEPSGFMRDVGGKTVLVTDPAHKLRRDHVIEDEKLQRRLAGRIQRRLLPMIRRAFQFEASRMERYLIGCYDAESGGHFRPHRDNTTKGTAHRRFAVTINLNAGDYEGGDLRFPEFGPRTYRAPTGGAVVFSCGLLHEATPVTRGTRYAFLPFLYDEAAAEVREANNPYLGEDLAAYRKSAPGS